MLLFSYGTLQHKHVQLATFGRELVCHKDSLGGYVRTITDVRGVPYYNIEPIDDPENIVSKA